MKYKCGQRVIEIKTLEDRAYDLLGEMICIRDGEIALQEMAIEDEQHSEISQELDAFHAEYDKQIFANITRYFRRKKIVRIIFETTPRFVKRVVTSLGIFFLTCSIAFATSPLF